MSRNFYDAKKFQNVTRRYFNLPAKFGGDADNGGYTFGLTNPGTLTHVEKWYPAGAIEIKKIGVFTASTSNNASGAGLNFRFLTRGASASVIGTIKWASATQAEGVISGSKIGTNLTVRQCKKGEYITIQTFEPTTITNGTEVKATTSGGAAFFIDYRSKFNNEQTGWDT